MSSALNFQSPVSWFPRELLTTQIALKRQNSPVRIRLLTFKARFASTESTDTHTTSNTHFITSRSLCVDCAPLTYYGSILVKCAKLQFIFVCSARFSSHSNCVLPSLYILPAAISFASTRGEIAILSVQFNHEWSMYLI
jgi:hypothetical protein